jgi:hypothetical protein
VKPETVERIRSAAHAELARTPRPRPWWRDAVALVAINTAVVIVFAVALGATRFFGNATSPAVLVAVAIPTALVIVLGAVAAVMPGGRWAPMSALALVAVASVAIVLGGSGTKGGRSFLTAGLPCLSTELITATIPVAAVIAVSSRFAYDRLRILVGGLSGGATGLLALHLHCRIGTASHLVVFHALPWMAAAGIALFIRSRVRSRSFAP